MGDAVRDRAADGGFGASEPNFRDIMSADHREAHQDALEVDSGDEADPLLEPVPAPNQFRLEQQDLFKALVLENAAKVDEKQEKKRLKCSANIDDGLTIEQLMQEQSKVALNDPREYQLELFERAKKENTIAVLETGSGKTLIAVLLIRHILDQELEDRAKGLSPRTTFFMVWACTFSPIHG